MQLTKFGLLALVLLGCGATCSEEAHGVVPPRTPHIGYLGALMLPEGARSVLVVGGRDGAGALSARVTRVEIRTGAEYELQPLSVTRSGGGWVRSASDCTLFGGETEADGPSDAVVRLGSGESAFVDVGRLPVAMSFPAVASLETELVLCGHDDAGGACWLGLPSAWRRIADIPVCWPRQIVVERGGTSLLFVGVGSPEDCLGRVDLRDGRVDMMLADIGTGAQLVPDASRVLIVPGAPTFTDPAVQAHTDILAMASGDTVPVRAGFAIERTLSAPSVALVDARLLIVGGGAAQATSLGVNGECSAIDIPKDLRGGLLVVGSASATPVVVGTRPWSRRAGAYPYAQIFRLPAPDGWLVHRCRGQQTDSR